MWNRDANWANDTAVTKMNQALTDGAAQTGLTNYVVLDMSPRRSTVIGSASTASACSKSTGSSNWTEPGAADRTEWVSQIRTVTTIFGPYQLQEGIHSSYWGQQAMRNCLRQALQRRRRTRRQVYEHRRPQRRR